MHWRKNFDGAEEHRSFAIVQLRADFQSQPPELQRETRARVRRLLAAEAERGQRQPSYLRRIAPDVYGIKL